MNAKDKERSEAIESLRAFIRPGDTIYTKMVHVSRSGMYRVIDLYVIQDNRPRRISYTAAKLLEGYDDRHEGCKAGGCGMDMGFHLVYTLSSILFRGGFECIGKECRANDHFNDPTGPRGAGVMHRDPGYALRHEWL